MDNKKKYSEVLHTSRREFYANDFKELDRELTDEQRAEWNAIYASFESRSLMNGTVIGLDAISLPASGNAALVEDGAAPIQDMPCLVVVQYRVKVLIPEPFVWSEKEQDRRGSFVMNSMIGSKVDYIIIGVDREGGCAVASRADALEQQRWHARSVRRVTAGDIVPCTVLAVGAGHLTLTACGYDVTLTQAGLSYSFLGDLRQIYHVGQELRARVLAITEDSIALSVRDAEPNPFEGAEYRHPVGSTRMATIVGKYAGGVFTRLTDGCTVVCKYAQHFTDSQFTVGDKVLVQIREFSDDRQWLKGKIRGRL